jgi:transglutaminase-like putative cysteine protease
MNLFDQHPFAAPPIALLPLARGVAPGFARLDLGVRYDLVFEGERLHVRTWTVWVVGEPHALGPAGWVSARHRVGEQPEPTVEARVVTPDGRELRADHADRRTREDRVREQVVRTLAVPLPGLVAGAVVETVTQEQVVAIGPPAWFVPRPSRGRLVVRARGDALRTAASGGSSPWKPVEGGFDLDVDGAPGRSLALMAPGEASGPVYAVGATDDELALAAAWMERAPTSDPQEDWRTRMRSAADPVVEAHRIAGAEVRWAPGGDRPWGAPQIGQGLYGDCKDKAHLMVALLREAGVPASVALVRVHGADAPEGVASLAAYDHAIVHLGGDRWVDPTDPRPVGALDPRLAGRRALVVDGPERGPRRLPASLPVTDTLTITRTIDVPLLGVGKVREVVDASGCPAGRWWMSPDDEQATAERASRWNARGARVEVDLGPDRLRTVATFEQADPYGGEGPIGVSAWFADDDLFDAVAPYADELERAEGDVWIAPGRRSITWDCALPPGVRPAANVAPVSLSFGTARFTSGWSATPRGWALEATFEVDDGRLSRANARALARRLEQGPAEVPFTWEPLEILATGDLPRAVAEADRLLALAPRSAALNGLRAMLWAAIGLRDAAAGWLGGVDVDDEGARQAWLAAVLAWDTVGNPNGQGDDVAQIEALQRAVDAGNHPVEEHLVRARAELGEPTDAVGALVARWEEAGDASVAEALVEAWVKAGDTSSAAHFAREQAPWITSGARVAADAVEWGTAPVLAGLRSLDDRRLRAQLLGKAWWTLVTLGRTDLAREVRAAILEFVGPNMADVVEDARLPDELGPDQAPLRALDQAVLTPGLEDLVRAVGPIAAARAAYGRGRVVERVGDAALVTARLVATEIRGIARRDGDRWIWAADEVNVVPAAVEAVARFDAGDRAGGEAWTRWSVDLAEGVGFVAKGAVKATGPAAFAKRVLRLGGGGRSSKAQTALGRAWRALGPEGAELIARCTAGAAGCGEAALAAPDEVFADLGALALDGLKADPAAAAAFCEAWLQRDPQDLDLRGDRVVYLARAGDRAGVEAALASMPASARTSRAALVPAMVAWSKLHDVPRTLRAAQAVIEHVDPEDRMYGSAAWYLLFGDEEQRSVGADAIEAALEDGERHEHDLHSAAVARLLVGQPAGALQAMQEAMAAHGPTLIPAWDAVRAGLAAVAGLQDVADALIDGLPDDGPFSDAAAARLALRGARSSAPRPASTSRS